MSVDFLMRMSYWLMGCGCVGIGVTVILYRKLEISRAWHILFAVPLPKKVPKLKEEPSKEICEETVDPTQLLMPSGTVVLYEETMIHTSEVI